MSCPTIIQVTNISPQTSSQQMTELFSYLGDIKSLKLFPEDENKATPSKVCFVDFNDTTSVSTALHLTNTIFIDRALVISRSRYDCIPGEEDALTLAAPAVAIAANQTKSIGHTAPLLPTPPAMTPLMSTPSIAPGLIGVLPSMMSGLPSISMHLTPPTLPSQPLISMMGTVVPPAPPLTGNVDPTKIEEIRRTVYVGNLNSALTADQVLNFFLPCGEIRYVRMAGDETQPTRFVFVEFGRPESVPIALQYNGAMFGDRPIKVNHSKNAIVKPQGPSAVETKREVDEAMKKVLEATMAITASINTEEEKPKKRSRTRSRTRSRSHDRRRGSRSHSRDRYRKRSRDRSPPYYSRAGYGRNRGSWRDPVRRRSRSPPKRRSRSPPRRRSRSPPRRRSRSPPRRRSRSPKRRSRSPKRRSRSPKRRSRSPPKRRSRSPPKRRSRSPPRRRSRSPRKRSRSPIRKRSRSPVRRRSRSPRHRLGDRSTSRSKSPTPKRDRKRKRASSRTSRSPSPARRSSRRKDHRRRSRSRSPFEEYGPVIPSSSSKDPGSSSNSRAKKKKHKHRHHKHRSPSPSLSPQGLSPSPGPSPPPKKPKRKRRDSDDEDDRSSIVSGRSRKSGISEDGDSPVVGRSGGEDSELEVPTRQSSSPSPSPMREEEEKADSDSSYD